MLLLRRIYRLHFHSIRNLHFCAISMLTRAHWVVVFYPRSRGRGNDTLGNRVIVTVENCWCVTRVNLEPGELVHRSLARTGVCRRWGTRSETDCYCVPPPKPDLSIASSHAVLVIYSVLCGWWSIERKRSRRQARSQCPAWSKVRRNDFRKHLCYLRRRFIPLPIILACWTS